MPRAKVVVAGGFGAGKTTFVRSVSDILPLETEAGITSASLRTDDLTLVPGKRTTTVSMDFGRVSVDDELDLYLFGTPGQDRYSFMWDTLVLGAVGVIVLVDVRRLADSFHAVDYLEERGLPYVVAVNRFDGRLTHDLDTVREAMGIGDDVVIVDFDARDRSSALQGLVRLVDVAMRQAA